VRRRARSSRPECAAGGGASAQSQNVFSSIALIGSARRRKSTLGKNLAKKIARLDFVELNNEIESRRLSFAGSSRSTPGRFRPYGAGRTYGKKKKKPPKKNIAGAQRADGAGDRRRHRLRAFRPST